MENPTSDLSEFGYIEIKEAARLLNAYVQERPEFLNSQIKIFFNKNSGCVFLSDEDFNVAMMNGDKLEQWFSCPSCGHEGFKEDMKRDGDEYCKDYLAEVGLASEEEE